MKTHKDITPILKGLINEAYELRAKSSGDAYAEADRARECYEKIAQLLEDAHQAKLAHYHHKKHGVA